LSRRFFPPAIPRRDRQSIVTLIPRKQRPSVHAAAIPRLLSPRIPKMTKTKMTKHGHAHDKPRQRNSYTPFHRRLAAQNNRRKQSYGAGRAESAQMYPAAKVPDWIFYQGKSISTNFDRVRLCGFCSKKLP
jgi:hypothetical protein